MNLHGIARPCNACTSEVQGFTDSEAVPHDEAGHGPAGGGFRRPPSPPRLRFSLQEGYIHSQTCFLGSEGRRAWTAGVRSCTQVVPGGELPLEK